MKIESGSVQENRYDVENLRFELLENGNRTRFVYHDGELLHEEGGKENSQTGYHLGAGIEAFSRGKEAYYYQQDEQLSTAFITGKNGTVHNSYQYDAFGNEIETAGQLPNRIRYTGQQYDEATGQYYLRARYYNPIFGRFMQEDTYQGDGLNLYAYCKNNPVTYYDPSGYADIFCKTAQFAGDSGDKPNYLNKYDIAPYGEFSKHPHDNLSGHELLQNAWLEANGKIIRRGHGLSKDNPAIALNENPMHKYITSQQRQLGLIKKNLVGTSWKQNVLVNIKIMKAAGVPRNKILELAKETKQFAIDNGF